MYHKVKNYLVDRLIETDIKLSNITSTLLSKTSKSILQPPQSISASRIKTSPNEESISNTNIEKISTSFVEEETNIQNNEIVTNNTEEVSATVGNVAQVELSEEDDSEEEVQVVVPNTHVLIHRSRLSQLEKKARSFDKLMNNLSQPIYRGSTLGNKMLGCAASLVPQCRYSVFLQFYPLQFTLSLQIWVYTLILTSL